VDFNLTFIGQSVAFFVFWWFCQSKVWPLFTNILDDRRQKIADGLEAAARGEKDS
jgi:F-type H+-transporting ATPase subunit b